MFHCIILSRFQLPSTPSQQGKGTRGQELVVGVGSQVGSREVAYQNGIRAKGRTGSQGKSSDPGRHSVER